MKPFFTLDSFMASTSARAFFPAGQPRNGFYKGAHTCWNPRPRCPAKLSLRTGLSPAEFRKSLPTVDNFQERSISYQAIMSGNPSVSTSDIKRHHAARHGADSLGPRCALDEPLIRGMRAQPTCRA